MKLSVNLDTHAVIAQPSPLRIKAASFVPIEITFTRGSQAVRLLIGTGIEFGLKLRNVTDGELLVFHDSFEASAGNSYSASVNCATTELHAALGISDGQAENDQAVVELSGEIGWSVDGQHFRSQTFPVIAEAPVVSSYAPAPLRPPNYPEPDELLLRDELPSFAKAVDAVAGIRTDVMMTPLSVNQWFNAKLPGDPGASLLGNGSWGLPDLSNYTGMVAGDGTLLSNVWAEGAVADQYGNSISDTYAQQSGYYPDLYVSYAEGSNFCEYAYSAIVDENGYTLYGAGNIQWDFFGGEPEIGNTVVYDGVRWVPTRGPSLPLTVENTAERLALTSLSIGWLVKQRDSRTVYQVLDPAHSGTELGWVPIGPFILVPENSTPLTLSQLTPNLGDQVQCSAGTWSDNPTSVVYHWERNGNRIAGANSPSYTVVATDDGARLTCVVSATNTAGTGKDSVSIPTVVLTPPANSVAPTILPSTPPNVGDTLSLTAGTWTGHGFTTGYQWKRNGSNIAGATALTYTTTAPDIGESISCTVTRTNIRGSASATTSATGAVTNLIAVNTALPTLSHAFPYVGASLTCHPGEWRYYPTSFTYQWKRDGAAISGATNATYIVTQDDVDATLACEVHAVNLAGTSAAVSSPPSASVTGLPVGPIRGSLADESLVAHWPLEELSGSRFDISGNGFHLAPNPSASITADIGRFGNAARLPARTVLSVTNSRFSTVKTVCGWFKLTAANSSYQRLLFASLQVYFGTSGISWDPSHATTRVVPTPNEWYFVCVMQSGGTIKLWVNQQVFTVQSVSQDAGLLGNTFTIGDLSYTSTTMLMDEVACWSRPLTDAEISTLANS